ncbi:MAG: CDP-alcohol phosphatidyltransferase family protein [Gammaproteobacteria bacterium]|nr:MAG: CDP-alcohol phosphatidyltransferase family protein [Gammaproteobacteria bacterium]
MTNIANLLSAFRLIAAPFLFYLAWTGRPKLFLVLLAFTLLSDAIDGFVARRLHVSSELGTRLDSWGDLVTFLLVPLYVWWLWPDIIRREAAFVLLVMGAFIIPITVGLLKFRQLTSYHTWSAKVVAVLLSVAVFLLIIADIAWPFRCAAVLLFLSACEEIAITLRLPELRSNVRSYWHIIRQDGETKDNI